MARSYGWCLPPWWALVCSHGLLLQGLGRTAVSVGKDLVREGLGAEWALVRGAWTDPGFSMLCALCSLFS